MNRRRFLKYAGASAAVVGASALGLDYLVNSPRIPVQQTSGTLMSTSSILSAASVSATSSSSAQLVSLQGRLFFDYNGNGKQDAGEPAVVGASVQLKDSAGGVIAQTLTDSSGDYKLEDVKTGTYRLHVGVQQFSDKRLRYMCRSPDEIRAVTDDYNVLLRGITRVDVGLMEGLITLPLLKETKIEISNLYDWDPRVEHVKWWDGTVLVPGDTDPVPYRTGFDNHSGIDYSIEVGSPIVAPAPGIVRDCQIGPQGQLGVQIYHDSIDFWTFYNHLSRIDVQMGQRVSRGQKFAESGESGTTFPHLHFNTKWVDTDGSFGFFDFYRHVFPIDEESSGFWSLRSDTEGQVWRKYPKEKNPNLLGYWTKDNDPQYPAS